VSGVGDLEEVQVSELFELSSGFAFNLPVRVVLALEVGLTLPFSSMSPCFSTTPVANPILITGVNKDFHVGVVEERADLRHEVSHPVSKEESVNEFVTLDPFASGNSEDFLDGSIVQEGVRLGEIVTKRRLGARLTDIVNIELGM